jgi:hypothetical protein
MGVKFLRHFAFAFLFIARLSLLSRRARMLR